MARPEAMMIWFKRNMNRVKTADTEHLVFYTALSIIFLIFVGIIVFYLNIIFLIDNLFTPAIFSYVRLKLNTFNVLVYFICYYSSEYVLNFSRLLRWS
jgi:hypothetical protein